VKADDYDVYLDRLYTMLAGIVCPECDGDGCEACEGVGSMTEEQFSAWRRDHARDED
jgi:hypothetical protein